MNVEEFDIALSELETRVERLRSLYENWFRGYEKSEPTVPRKDVERRVYGLRKELPRNTALRFRYHQLYLKYTTMANYWQRTARQIEEGTYKPQLERLKRKLAREQELAERRERRKQERPDEEREGPRAFELDLDESLDVDDLLGELELDDAPKVSAPVAPLSEAPPTTVHQRLPPAGPARATATFARAKEDAAPPAAPAAPQRAPAAASFPNAPFPNAPAAALPSTPGKAASPALPGALPARPAAGPTSEPRGPLPPAPNGAGKLPAPFTPNVPGASRPQAPTAPAGKAPWPPPPPLGAPSPFAAGKPAPAPAAPAPSSAGRLAPTASVPSTGAAARPPANPPLPSAAARPPTVSVPQGPAPAAPAGALARPPAPAAGPRAPASPGMNTNKTPAASGGTFVGRPPQSSPLATGDGAPNEQRLRHIYNEYAEARRRNNEGEVRYEALVSSIQKMLPELSKKHQGKQIDFDIVVKDGRVGLKPKAK